MRINYLAILTFLLITPLSAQPWLSHLPSGKSPAALTLFDYQQAFESYWAPYKVNKGSYIENGVTKKAPGWKHFKRWEYQMSSLVDPTTGAFPQKSALEVRHEFEQNHPVARSTSAADWTPMGPTTSFSGYSGIGRLNCVAFHPTETDTYWVGAAAGGLWETRDNGASWECLTDNNGVLAVSDIIIPEDYAVSNTIYIATGDRDGWDNRSIGVLKSTDGGNTWDPTGLSFSIADGQMTNRLLQDPTNKEVLIASTTAGVFKTVDGGDTWNLQLTGVQFIDMEYKPGNSSIIYGSTKDGKIFTSTDGLNFEPILDDGEARRIELAVSPDQPDWVYALASNSSNGLYGIFKSTDSGASFIKVFSGDSLNLLTWSSNGDGSDGQGWYDLALASSPMDANIILVGGVNTWRSLDGGIHWTIVNHWVGSNAQAVHADKHQLAFRSNGDLFECNDGGIYLSKENGINWVDKTNGIQISQMYRLGVSQTDPDDVITGLQDNGTKLYSGGNWYDARGGDGMECLIDYTDVNIQYNTVYYGSIDRTTNHWQNSTNITPPDDGNWVTPYIIDPNNPNILYGGYNEVWKTEDRGDNWIQISSISIGGRIRSMAAAPSDSQYLYVAGHREIWKTSNGGDHWDNITGDLPTGSASIEYIAVKYDDANTLWVTLSGYSTPGVYTSIDGGTTWTNISEGLPGIPVYSVVHNRQSTSTVDLYAGTELGVYYKKGNSDWIPYNEGLPNVKTGEIEIYYSDNPGESKLRAATYGRGLWETSLEYLSTPMVYISSTAIQNSLTSVSPDQIDQEILKIEIYTNGNLTPFSASSFTFNTTGSTNPLNDIVNAKLYFSSTSNTFSTANQFGETIISPDGTFTFTGSQLLGDGKNNFWLTYDIAPSAVLGNKLDAQCTSLFVEESRSPLVSNPPGSRTISLKYCDAGAAELTYEYISRVIAGAVDHRSEKEPGGYADFTSEVVDMTMGSTLEFYVSNGVPYFADQVLVWVDWNKDGDFEDVDETVFISNPSGTDVFEGSFTTSLSATTGTTRMRIRLHDSQNGPLDAACGFSQWGEVEDYSLRVSAYDPCAVLNYFDYTASSIPGDYVSLDTTGVVISTPNFDDANSAPHDIGFAFEYMCQPFTQFILNTNGFIKLGATPPSRPDLYYTYPRDVDGGIFDNNDTADVNILSPLNIDLAAGAGQPEYRVHTSGKAPNRICTIQFKDITEANGEVIPQFDKMQFQIKLYETSHIIEFVYGDWIPSGNDIDGRPVACGLKGLNRADNQVLMVSKNADQTWEEVTFTNTIHHTPSAIYYEKPPESPKPDAGRTFRFTPVYDSELAINEIYALGEASLFYSSPQTIGVNVTNNGINPMINVPVILQISGANDYTDTLYVDSIEPMENVTLNFSNFVPASPGTSFINVSLPHDQNNVSNVKSWTQEISDFNCTYASADEPSSGWEVIPSDADTLILAKYTITGEAQIEAVTAFIFDGATIGERAYGVLVDHNGFIIGQSDVFIIGASDLGQWHTFSINNPPIISNNFVYAGLLVPPSTSNYFLVGVQNENPQRPETFFKSALGTNELLPINGSFRLMIGAILSATSPVSGEAKEDHSICEGSSTSIDLIGSHGFIHWQESLDGMTNWVNVSSGTGGHTPHYNTPTLSTEMHYRAEVIQPTFPAVYSNVVTISVHQLPIMSGPIDGLPSVCQGLDSVLYVVPEMEHATLYQWSFPPGSTGSSTTNSILISYTALAMSGFMSVVGINETCAGDTAKLEVIVIPQPMAPEITNTENILQSDAVTGNQWYDENGPISGATGQEYTALSSGEYYVIVTTNGCSSAPSNRITIILSVISEPGKDRIAIVYPNPVNDKLTVEVPGDSQTIAYEILDIWGRVERKGDFSAKVILETAGMASGLYFIQLVVDGQVVTKKFVKE